jgi:hypothetical protein
VFKDKLGVERGVRFGLGAWEVRCRKMEAGRGWGKRKERM